MPIECCRDVFRQAIQDMFDFKLENTCEKTQIYGDEYMKHTISLTHRA